MTQVAGMVMARPRLVDLMMLADRARPDEIAQYESLVGRSWDRDEVAVGHFNRDGVKFLLAKPDGTPVCAGGWDPVGPDVWQSWMIGTMDDWRANWRAITKGSRLVMNSLFSAGARRLQTNALASRVEACEWYIRGLLMQREGTMRGYGVNGEDVAMFARLRGPADG